SSRRRHTRLQGDWSSDVCSSDLNASLATSLAEVLFHRGRERRMQIEHILALAVAAFVELLVHRRDEARLGLLERDAVLRALGARSEERRVGKEGRVVSGAARCVI